MLDVVEARSAPVSLGHAAPEVIEGRRPTESADIYSLGSTLFELLTGSTAFVASTNDEQVSAVLSRIQNAPVPDLRRRGVPDAVCDVLESAMAKQPSARPESAAVLAERLRVAVDPRATRPMTPPVPVAPVVPPVVSTPTPPVSPTPPEPIAVVPEPEPTPIPEPEPEPEPAPVPGPDPEPDPAPIPDPMPVPEPEPEPTPVPVPDPEPDPLPAPVLEAEPESEPETRLFATRPAGTVAEAQDAEPDTDAVPATPPGPAPLSIPSLPMAAETTTTSGRVFEGEPDESSRSRGRLVRFGLGALVALISLIVLVLVVIDSSRSKVGTPTASVTPQSSAPAPTTTPTLATPSVQPDSLVFPTVLMPSGLHVTRTWRLTGDDGNRFLASVEFANPTTKAITDSIVEVIPKLLTDNVAKVQFLGMTPTVLKADPVVRFDVTVQPGGKERVGYSIAVPAEGVGKARLDLWKVARDNEQKALDLLLTGG